MTDKIDSKVAFIIGHYKSGSTWLAHLLSLYPGVRGVREAHVFRYVKSHNSLKNATEELFTESAWGVGGIKSFPHYWLGNITRSLRVKTGLATGTATLSASDVPASMLDLGLINQYLLRKSLQQSKSGDEYCRLFFSSLVNRYNPDRYLIEKTPTNVFYVDDIKRIFPRSKLISIHRDGRDVVVSDKHHLKRAYNTTESFSTMVNKWKNAMEAEIRKVDKYNIHQLSYEDLKLKPEKTIKALLCFLELDYDDELINSLNSGSSFKAMSGGRTAGDEDTSKFTRKGIVGDWRNSFSDDEVRIFSEIAGELLVKLGYETSPSWKQWV